MTKLRRGKAPGICSISAELLRAGGEALIWRLHVVLVAIWQSDIPADWKRELVVPI